MERERAEDSFGDTIFSKKGAQQVHKKSREDVNVNKQLTTTTTKGFNQSNMHSKSVNKSKITNKQPK